MEIIIYFIIFFFTFSFGLAVGYFKFHEEHGTLDSVKVPNIFKKKSIGSAMRPSADRLRKKGTAEEVEEKIMEETFDKLLSNK